MLSHAEARAIFAEAYRSKYGVDGRVCVLQALAGVAWLETQYASGWGKAGAGSWNFGAIQSGRTPCDPSRSFEYTDTSPKPDGTSTPYRICFRKYASPLEGAADLVRVMYQKRPLVLAAAESGELYDVSTALYDTVYYQGFGKTREARIRHHHTALLSAVTRIARSLREPMPDGSPTPRRTLRLTTPRMTGTDVGFVQVRVGAKHDDVYGPETARKVKEFQTSRPGLRTDGIVGPGTWAALDDITDAELALGVLASMPLVDHE